MSAKPSASGQSRVQSWQRTALRTTALLCCLLLCSPAFAQKPGKPRGMKPGQDSGQRGGGRGRHEPQLSEQLPAPFHGISNEELPILQQVALRAKRWILYDTAPESPFAPVRVSFSDPSAATISDQQKLTQLEQQLCQVLQKVREQKQLQKARALETEARRTVQELGRVEAEAELKNADSEQRSELKRMARRAAVWTAQATAKSAAENSEQIPPKKERSPDPQLQDFLTALLPPQQQELRQVFDAELRRRRQLLLLSATATASLQVLRSAPVLDEKKVQQATVACAQLQFSTALAESVSFETIRQSVSKQQLEYLTGSGEQ